MRLFYKMRLVGSVVLVFSCALVALAETSGETMPSPSTGQTAPATQPPPTSSHGNPAQPFMSSDNRQMPPTQNDSFEGRPQRSGESMPNPNQRFQPSTNVRPMQQRGDFQAVENHQNQQGGMNQPGKGNQMQGGKTQTADDWEAEQQKMDREQEKREAVMVKKQAAQMAKMLQTTVASLQKRAVKLKSAGIMLTSECAETLATFTEAVTKAKNATTQDDLYDLQDTMESRQDLDHCRQVIERLITAPKMLKNASITIKNLKKKKVDVSEAEEMLKELMTTFATFKTSVASNDDVEAFFESANELGDTVAPLMEHKPENFMQGASVFDSLGFWDNLKDWLGF